MEYSSLQSSSLGGSQIQGTLASSLNSEKYTVEKKETGVVFKPNGHFFSPLADNNDYGFVDTSNNNESEETDDEEEKEEQKETDEEEETEEEDTRFKFTKDPINSFFIGSITVVGLFVLYRLLQNKK